MNTTDRTETTEPALPTGRVVIAGGSGFLGMGLARHLTDAGREVVILSRSAPAPGPWSHAVWDGRTVGEWARTLDGAAGLGNLGGRTVECIKTLDHCDEILRSRVESTRVLGEAMRGVSNPPPVWVQMATAHRYGDSELPCDESAAFGYGLAPIVGEAWENAFDDACPEGVRRVVLRTGFVLGPGGGAYATLSTLARFGLGGTVGSGRQDMSWIHIHDMNRLFVRGLTDPSMHGAYIASGPNPVSNRVFMRELRRSLGMPIGLPAFAWMVRLGASLVMKTDPELALYGRYCLPAKLLVEGFGFRYPDLPEALAACRP